MLPQQQRSKRMGAFVFICALQLSVGQGSIDSQDSEITWGPNT